MFLTNLSFFFFFLNILFLAFLLDVIVTTGGRQERQGMTCSKGPWLEWNVCYCNKDLALLTFMVHTRPGELLEHTYLTPLLAQCRNVDGESTIVLINVLVPVNKD